MDLLQHIRIFVDIADQGSLAAVARSRSVTPSSVTASLQRLEDHVGTTLILRSTRKLSFTPEGDHFLTSCRRILTDLDDAVDQLSDAGPLRGTIRITSVNDFGRTYLAPSIDQFLRYHPEVKIHLVLGDQMMDLIAEGFDLAIRTGPLPDSQLMARLFHRGGISICASPGYWDKHGRPRHPSELANHNCIYLSRLGNPQSVWRFQDGDTTLPVHVSGDRTGNDGGLLRSWAVSGAGVIRKFDYDIAADVAAGRLETVLNEYRQPDTNLYIVHPSGEHPSRRVKAFIDFLLRNSEQ
jgi:DNA-binding transcriptional LysR family regulator